VKIGVIGCGFIATNAHLPILTRHHLVDSVSIADVDEAKLAATAENFGIPRSLQYRDYSAMLETDVDAVLVLTPPHLHAKFAMDALNHAKHVFVEKPLCLTSDEAHEISEDVRRTGKILGVGYHLRFMPQIQLCKSLLRFVGTPMFLSASFLADDAYARKLGPDSFYLSPEKGGGVLTDAMGHLLDTATWLSDSRIMDVKGFHNTFDSLPVENAASATIRLENGVLGCLRALWAPLPEFFHTRSLKFVEIVGSKGYVQSELYAGLVKLYRKGRGTRTFQCGSADNPMSCLNKAYRDEMTAFLNSVKTGEMQEPLVNANQAAYTVALTEKLRSD
jgi:predicted dehydrogenase